MPTLLDEEFDNAYKTFTQTQCNLDATFEEIAESINQLANIIVNSSSAWRNKNHENLATIRREIKSAKEVLPQNMQENIVSIENNNLYTATPLEYAYFCFLTYQHLSSQQDTPLIGWKLLDRVRVTDGFEAGVFQQDLEIPQEETGHIVIAFKGYLPNDANPHIGQLIETLRSFWEDDDDLTRYLDHGLRLYHRIREKFPTSSLSFTGHGLGAVLAEILAVHNDRKAVTFDSLGSKPALESLNFERFEETKELITSYFSYPNLFNTLNEQIAARRFLLHIPKKEIEIESPWGQHLLGQLLLLSAPVVGVIFNFTADVLDHVKKIWKLTIYQHDIRHHLLAFDASTHQPRHYIKIHAWPSFQGQAIGEIADHLWQHVFNNPLINNVRVREAFDGRLLEWRASGKAFPRANRPDVKYNNQSSFVLAGWASLLLAIFYSIPRNSHGLLSTLIFLPASYWEHTISQTDELKLIKKANCARIESEQLKISVAENADKNQLLLNLPSWNTYQYHSMNFWQRALNKPIVARRTRNTIEGLSLFLISALLMGIEFNGNIMKEEKTNYYLQFMYIGTLVCFGVKTFLPLDKLETAYFNWRKAHQKWRDDPEAMEARAYFDNYKRI